MMYHFSFFSVMGKSKAMIRIFGFLFIVFFFADCRSQGASNEYKDAKHHPSEQIAGEQKKAMKKAQRDFVKQQKKNNKAIGQHGHIWSKKKAQYTH